ncbi:phytoene desaturase family protein [Pedobacter sp. Du54]|uniref:phytoene desaturase family protein n=1 Tax=Pedobacter anseongensis TaxID=3133439 RepID=UPI00309FD9F2
MSTNVDRQSVAIIGAGFAGLSAAAYLAKAGYQVEVFEKNKEVGGRARQFKTEEGYVFDMGPSWYWMPEVFEKFFSDFGYTASDFYELVLLDPSFSVIFKDRDLAIPSNYADLRKLFEEIEPGSALKLDAFMKEAEFKYNIGMKKLVYKPGISLTEFVDLDLIKGIFKLQVFTSFSKHVKKYFKHPKLIALMEFPVLFLGATPEDTPALYSLMNYAGLKLGTWYPKGGFGEVVHAMKKVGENLGVKFHLEQPVINLQLTKNRIQKVVTHKQEKTFDAIIASADYHHIEQELLPEKFRNYSKKYWDSRVLAPSCLIFYLGINKRLTGLQHHTLFFDEDLKKHAMEIYKDPKWPDKPLFYVCCPSKTDSKVAPENHENVFILIPIATDLSDTTSQREKYFDLVIKRLEQYIGEEIISAIAYKKSYCVNDFKLDYNSFKGNAYGLANTLKQTANLKPSIENKMLNNLFYSGQLTVPGPGVPPSIISGTVAANEVIKYLKHDALRVNNPINLKSY